MFGARRRPFTQEVARWPNDRTAYLVVDDLPGWALVVDVRADSADAVVGCGSPASSLDEVVMD
eukprot:5527621-Pyramimonas_sp.AAC.1